MKKHLLLITIVTASMAVLAQEPFYQWSVPGSFSSSQFQAMVLDKQGNVYVTGPTTQKYGPAGNLIWSAAVISNSNSVICMDDSGNIYVASHSGGIIVSKCGPDGSVKWTSTFEGIRSGYDNVSCIAVSQNGYVYIGGTTAYEYSAGEYSNGYLLVSMTTDSGTITGHYAGWALSGVSENIEKIVVAPSGDVYAAGNFTNPETDVAVFRFSGVDSVWSQQSGDYSSFTDMAIDNAENVYVAENNTYYVLPTLTSYTSGGSEINGDEIFNSGSSVQMACVGTNNIFVAANIHDVNLDLGSEGDNKIDIFDPHLTAVEDNTTDPNGHYATSLAKDGLGNTYVVGYSENLYPEETLIAKFNSNAIEQWELIDADYLYYGYNLLVDSTGQNFWFIDGGNKLVKFGPPVSTITSFTPTSGPPGTLVTITGTNLDSITSITIGDTGALLISNSSSTQAVGFVMPGAITGPITITNNLGTGSSTGNFAVTPTPYPTVQQGGKLVGAGYIKAAPPDSFVLQGQAVAVSADGNTAVVTGPADNSLGAAWMFVRNGDTWSQQGGKLVGSDAIGYAGEGNSAALSADGNTAVIGGTFDDSRVGAIWVFTRTGTTWTQQGPKLVGTGYTTGIISQGAAVALSADGNTLIEGGPGDNNLMGAVWIFTRSGGTWSQDGAKLVAPGGSYGQGTSVAISSDGNTALVGVPEDNNYIGAAWVFTNNGGTWTQQGAKLVGSGYNNGGGYVDIGSSVALSADGNTALIGGDNDSSLLGAAWVFTRSDTTWARQGAKLVGSGYVYNGDEGVRMGWSAAISADGNTAVIGGPQDDYTIGAAWIFTRSGTTWTQQGSKLVGTGYVSIPGYGPMEASSVALSSNGSTALIGGPDNNNEVGAAWVFISAPLPPQGSLSDNGPFCGSGTGQLTFTATAGTGPFMVVYNDGTRNDTATGAVSGTPFNVYTNPVTSTTTYTLVSVTDANDSVTTSGFTGDTAIITVNPVVTAAITGATTGCGEVSLTAGGGTTYVWSGGSDVSSATDTFSSSGTYAVTVTGTGGCTDTASQTVTINALPSATVSAGGTTTFCNGDSVILTAGNDNSYLWSTSATTQSIAAKQTGNYTVVVADANGCSATSTATAVTVNPLPAATITAGGSTAICTGDSVILTASSGSSYLWSTTATTAAITVNQTGSYTVLVTDANGCSAQSSPTSVTVNTSLVPSLNTTANPPGAVCAGTNITFTSTESGGGSSPAYQWEINGINTGTGADSLSTSLLQNNDIVSCILTSSAGCANPDTAASNSIIVTVNALVTPSLTITSSQGDAFCAGTPDTFTAATSNGGNAPAYTWLIGGSVQSGNDSTFVTNDLLSGSIVSCILVSSASCASPDTVSSNRINVTVNPAPNASITPSGAVAVCQGDSVELSAAAGNIAYEWNTQATTQNIYAQFSANYSVTVTNLNNCTAASAPVTVTVNSLPLAPVISKSNDTLTSSVATSYQWYLNDSVIPSANQRSLVITSNGSYTVQTSDSNGCQNASAAMNITTLGIENISTDYTVQLYPNPNNGNFTLQFSDNIPRSVSITDVTGRTIIEAQQVATHKDFDCAALPGGVYLLQIKENTEVRTLRFVITK